MLHEVRLFLIAMQFLTRVPAPAWAGWRPDWMQASARHFPAVGLLVGACGSVVLWSTAHLWPGAVAVGLSMVATVWMTGALHEQGLADTCDALGGSVSRERSLQMLKEPRIGSYGSVGLLAVLGLKAAALYGLAAHDFYGALVVLPLAHAWSRAVPVLLLRWLPQAGEPGPAGARPMAAGAGDAAPAVALLWCVLAAAAAMACGVSAAMLLPSAIAVLVVALLMARWLRLRLGGRTGATLGAAQQGAELAVYLALLAVVSHG